ncbi:MAG: 50S ribosomal protein L35 [Bdellovibrionales bacterium]|nr:50S ribosomal protein L35 [Bdellovibrionales bacterium]
MKMKTHSGAKKRLRLKSSGKVKRKYAGKRHLLNNKSSKNKRLLGKATYVHSASEYQVNRLLVF